MARNFLERLSRPSTIWYSPLVEVLAEYAAGDEDNLLRESLKQLGREQRPLPS